MRPPSAALLAAACVGLAGCAGDAASVDTAPLAVVRAAQASVASSTDGTSGADASHRGARAVVRRSAVPAGSEREAPTPAASPRARTATPSRALPASAAPRLAAPACEQYVAALAGRLPAPVRERDAAQGLAIVTDAIAAALLGMPIVAPRAASTARERLDDAHARLSRALAAGEGAQARAIAQATAPRIRAYAEALDIAGCG